MAKRLFQTKDRDEAHKKLEEILADGVHQRAECREPSGDPEDADFGMHTVWDGPQREHGFPAPPAPEPSPPEVVVPAISEEHLGKLADMIAERMLKGR